MLTPLPSNLLPGSDIPSFEEENPKKIRKNFDHGLEKLGFTKKTFTSAFKENLTEAQKRFDRGLKELGFTKETIPSLSISYAHANRKPLAEYLQSCWAGAFGIDVQLEAIDWNTLRSNLSKGKFNVSFTYSAPYYNDPIELLEYFSNINSCNFSQWVHPRYSEKIYSGKREKDLQKRTQYFTEAEQLLLEQMPLIPICSDKMNFSHNPKLEGYVFDCVGAIDFSYASFKNS